MPQSGHFSSLYLWFLPPTHPHAPKSKCQFVGRPLSSQCSPLHISSYRSVPSLCYRATCNSPHYSTYCRHTYVLVHANPHARRGVHRKVIEQVHKVKARSNANARSFFNETSCSRCLPRMATKAFISATYATTFTHVPPSRRGNLLIKDLNAK